MEGVGDEVAGLGIDDADHAGGEAGFVLQHRSTSRRVSSNTSERLRTRLTA
jgi:hypothetical protein